MATTTAFQPAPASRKLLVHTALSLCTLVLGIVLLIYMVTVEDEPGALPLALIVGGITWLIIARMRLRAHGERGRGPDRTSTSP